MVTDGNVTGMHLVEFPGTTRNTVPGNDLPVPPAQDEYAVTVSVNAIAIHGTVLQCPGKVRCSRY